MKVLIIILILIQVFIDGWCIAGVLNNTKAIKRLLDIIDLFQEDIYNLKVKVYNNLSERE